MGGDLQFELLDGRTALGRISRLEREDSEVVHVAGLISHPESGRFFFQKQTKSPGTGELVGVVEFPESRTAYRLEPDKKDGSLHLVEHALATVLCLELPHEAGIAAAGPQPIPPLAPGDAPDVPIPAYQQGIAVRESLPGAKPVIYLDFQGGYTPTWGGISYERPYLDNSQITDIWQRVAEDFMPFNINVTTDAQVYQLAAKGSRQRVIITPTDTAQPGAGGVGYVGSFNWTIETPCWVFVTAQPKECAVACSHEAGHALGLSHSGQRINGTHAEYYYGHGNGESGWAPIMGVGYYQNVTQWSKGEYQNANNLQDQLAIIASQTNVRFRADDAGDGLATSRYLETYDGGAAGGEGVIERSGDADAFRFTTGGGRVSLRADPVNASPNLALQVSIHDANDTLIAGSHGQQSLAASLDESLPAGTYTIRVTGKGRNNPLTDGFSDYGSLGYYSITGSVENAELPVRFSIPENLPAGAIVGTLEPVNSDGASVTYRISSGNPGNAFNLDNSGVLSVSNGAVLDYEDLASLTQSPVQFELLVDILHGENAALTETNRRVVVAVTNVNEPPFVTGMRVAYPDFSWIRPFPGPFPGPSLSSAIEMRCLGTNCSFDCTVPERSPVGTYVGTVIASDPDRHTLPSWSIVGGNDDGRFAIDRESGDISVASDLIAAVRTRYDLTVMVSDETLPNPLTVASHVNIRVTLPYPTGRIFGAVYRDIEGPLITDLTGDSRFPRDPDLEQWLYSFEAGNLTGDNHGVVVRGFLLPPATGNYTFWIASKDNGELWLSSSTNAADIRRIAELTGPDAGAGVREWTRFPSQQSAPIPLAMGHAYYIEARMKVGAGPGNLAVAWECAEQGLAREVIPGQYLAPFTMNYVPHLAGFSTRLHQDAIDGAFVGKVALADLNRDDSHLLTITSGNEAGLFSLDPLSGIVRVASAAGLHDAIQSRFALEVRVTDDGTPPLTDTTTLTIDIVPTNAITVESLQEEIWTSLSGPGGVSDLTGLAAFPKRPNALRVMAGFGSAGGFGTNYGSRLRAFVTPAETGLHTFYVAAGDGESQLKFSAEGNSATASIVAWVQSATGVHEWDRFSSQQSGAFWLVAGQRCYLEVLHRQSGQADHLEVGWSGPGLEGTNRIADSFLTPVDLGFPPEMSGLTATVSLDATNGTPVAAVTALDSPMDSVAFRIVSGNTGDTFAIDPASGRIVLANNSFLATDVVTNFSLVVEAQDSGYGGLYPLRVARAVVEVRVVDNTAPARWTGDGNDVNWSTAENWSGGVPVARRKILFNGFKGQTNRNDLLLEVDQVTFNNPGFHVGGNSLLLKGGITSRGHGTWAINSTLAGPQTFASLIGVLSITGTVNNNGHYLTLLANNSLSLDNAVSGTGGLFKSGPGRLVITSGNLYTGPTIINSGTLVLANSGSIDHSVSIELQSRSVLDVSGFAGPFVIPEGQTLKGVGTVIGPITVHGTLEQAALLSGSLTFSNGLTLAGDTFVRPVPPIGPITTQPPVRVVGELALGGRLLTTNYNQRARFGEVLKLFEADQYSGAFARLILPPLDRGLEWDTNRLAVDGTIRVTTPAPRLVVTTFTASSMVVRFPTAMGLNYRIETTTGLEDEWKLVTSRVGSGDTTTVMVPLTPGERQRFYRLRVF